MILLFLEFATFFTAIFGLTLAIGRWLAERKQLRVLDVRQQKQAEADREAAWRRNQQMFMR